MTCEVLSINQILKEKYVKVSKITIQNSCIMHKNIAKHLRNVVQLLYAEEIF